jgi:hypothetical protein
MLFPVSGSLCTCSGGFASAQMGLHRMRNKTWGLAWRMQEEVSKVKQGVLQKYKRKPDMTLSIVTSM